MSNELNPYSSPGSIDPSEPLIGRRDLDRAGLLATARGLSVFYWGIIVLVVTVLALALAMLLPSIVIFMFFGIVCGAFMMVIGMAMCIAVPRETNGRGLIIGSLVCQIVNVSASGFEGLIPDLPVYFSLVANLLGLVGNVLFLMFLRCVALYIGRQDLAKRSIVIIVMIVALIPIAIGAGVAAATMGEVGWIVLGATGIFALVTFVMFVNLINESRKAIKAVAESSEPTKPALQ